MEGDNPFLHHRWLNVLPAILSLICGLWSVFFLRADGWQDEDWGNKVIPTISKDQTHEHLRNLNVHDSSQSAEGIG